MTTELHTTHVNLSGLMEVLGRHLYSTPTVAIRELVQNAHDSCVRRKIETKAPFEPGISIQTDGGKLIIEDNGAGLTHDEIISYIATVGSGYTRILREKENDETLIGCFGLGFLSAYIIADRVELWTTSYQETDKGWRFVSNGPERYHLENADSRPIGMRLELSLTDDFLELADPYVLEILLKRYCCLLPMPVFLNNRETPLNDIEPPWRKSEMQVSKLREKKSRLDFAALFEPNFDPLCTIPVISGNDNEVSGLLWVHDASTYGSYDNRNVAVFIRGMLVNENERDLLPSWASFAGGVIESGTLSPTASREDIQKDEEYEYIREHLDESLISGLSEIARTDMNLWRRILRRHNEALLGAALCNDRLFDMLAKDLKVPTSEGDMTLPAIIARCRNEIYVSTGEKGSYEEVIFRAQMKPVVSGFRYAALPFCIRYGARTGIKVVQLGTSDGNKSLFKEETIDGNNLELLQKMLAKPGQEVVATRFQPDFLPLVLIPDRESRLKKSLESDEADKRISVSALSLARMYTKTISDKTSARLYVNMDSPIIGKFLELDGKNRERVATILKTFTSLITGHNEPELDINISEQFESFYNTILDMIEEKDL